MKLGFRNDESGAMAIEFALLAIPFLIFLIGMIEIGIKSLIQAELDHNTFKHANYLAANEDAGLTKQKYRETIVCPDFSVLLNCDYLEFGANSFEPTHDLTNEITSLNINSWNTGCAGSTVIFEMLYPIQHAIIKFAVADIVTHNGTEHFRSRALIRREPLIIGSGTLDGGLKC